MEVEVEGVGVLRNYVADEKVVSSKGPSMIIDCYPSSFAQWDSAAGYKSKGGEDGSYPP